jgi:formate dehydrogenase beta subunit
MQATSLVRHQTRILPALRQIQDKFGYLDREELRRFAQSSGIHLYQIQAVASFFPHFRQSPAAPVSVRVCRDMACHLAGSASLLDELSALKNEGTAVEGVSCLGRCDRPPAVSIAIDKIEGHSATDRAHHHQEFFCLARDASALKRTIAASHEGNVAPADGDSDAGRRYPAADWTIDVYKDAPRDYAAVKQLAVQPDRADWVLQQLDLAHANLRGMGGAGIAASQKWRDVRDAATLAHRRGGDSRAYVIVNGDESEPGTFKDRELLLHCPHLVLEGLIIAGLVTGATEGFLYIRHEFPEQIAACRAAIADAEAQGVCGIDATVLGRPFPVSVFVSPGGYICGEQSALIEAMSDRRGEPRNMPPGLETNGLDDRPTLVSNVETFAWVPYVVQRDGEAYAAGGRNGSKGRRFFSVCGDVNRPGVYEVPMGITFRELIGDYCQGIIGGLDKLKAIAPSGPSGGFLPRKLTAANGLPAGYAALPEWHALARRRNFDPLARELDILDLELELDLFRALSPTHALGAGIVVYAEGRDMVEQAVNAIEFFRNESCGKCVPCRVGSQKLANLGGNMLAGRVELNSWNSSLRPLMEDLSEVMVLSSICGLGRSVPLPLRTVIDYFGNDLERHLT